MKNRSFNIKKGDRVQVLSGSDKGKMGEVLKLICEKNRVLVQGIKMATKHVKASPANNGKSGRIQEEMPIHISNVALVCPKCTEATRVSHALLPKEGQDGKFRKVRVCKKCKEHIDS